MTLEKRRRKIPQIMTCRACGTSHTRYVHKASVTSLYATLRNMFMAEVLTKSLQSPLQSSVTPGEWSPRLGLYFSAPCFQARMVCPVLPNRLQVKWLYATYRTGCLRRGHASPPSPPPPISWMDFRVLEGQWTNNVEETRVF